MDFTHSFILDDQCGCASNTISFRNYLLQNIRKISLFSKRNIKLRRDARFPEYCEDLFKKIAKILKTGYRFTSLKFKIVFNIFLKKTWKKEQIMFKCNSENSSIKRKARNY